MRFKPDYVLFTDASLRRDDDKVYTAYAYAALNRRTLKFTVNADEMISSSIVYAEAYAIYQGLKFLNEKVSKGSRVLVVTDSKLNVQIIEEYIPNNWDTTDWNHWTKKDGTPVKNQKLYRKILKEIKKNDMWVKLIHINSHLDSRDIEYVEFKLEMAGIKLKRSTIHVFMAMNAVVDEAASDITRRIKSGDGFQHLCADKYEPS